MSIPFIGQNMERVFLSGRMMAKSRARIPLDDRGFRYGDGVFETIAVHGGVPYGWEFHLERLHDGLRALAIPAPSINLQSVCKRLLVHNALRDGFIRIAISRGSGGRGYAPPATPTPLLLIETIATPPTTPAAPASLWLSRTTRPPRSSLPTHAKLAHGIGSALALIEAQQHQANEALMLSADGYVCEAASGNLFWVNDKTLYTPSLECGALRGSVREALIRLSPLPVRHVCEGLNALQQAEAVFLTNCNWGIWPVARLAPSGDCWATGHPTVTRLTELLTHDITNQQESYGHLWR